MYIKMNKIKEDVHLVYYKFATDVDVGTHINEKGKLRTKWGTKTGYCIFNKQTEEFTLDKDKTDPYFTEKSREVIKVYVELIRRKQNNLDFSDIIDIATPG